MEKEEFTLKQLVFYFLILGATVFGGPLVPLTHIRKDLVDARHWISKRDFNVGLSLAQFTPGPLTTQVVMFLGWLHGGVKGATLAGMAYTLPSFIMVIVAADCYIRFSGISLLQNVSYGVRAAVIAIIAQNAFYLCRRTLRKDGLLWFIAIVNALLITWLQSGIVIAFVLSGLFVLGIRTFLRKKTVAISFMPLTVWLFSGVNGQISSESLGQVAWFFAKAGAIVFGGGVAIIPYLQQGVVYDFHWLTEHQFLDAVAIAMMTPGPLLIAVAFIGYLIAGLVGAIVATIATLLPCYLLVITIAPYYHKSSRHPHVENFVKGISAAAIGALFGASVMLAVAALVDVPIIILSSLCMGAIVFLNAPGVLLICLTGVAGILLKM
ncbi:MAG: chromate efflux transporter [Alphaproteobacteria bacterium]